MDHKLEALSKKYNISLSAVKTLAEALQRGNCQAAQFNHPELGGMGQWMPNMVMVGDMFNHQLKATVDQLCRELVEFVCNDAPLSVKAASSSQTSTTSWWQKAGITTVDTQGEQNTVAYAYSRAQNRLAIKHGERVTVYDTSDYIITGVSQQQSSQHTRIIIHTVQGNITPDDLGSPS